MRTEGEDAIAERLVMTYVELDLTRVSGVCDDSTAELVLHVVGEVGVDTQSRDDRWVVAPVVGVEPHLRDRVDVGRDLVAVVGAERRDRAGGQSDRRVLDAIEAVATALPGLVFVARDVPVRPPPTDHVGVHRRSRPW